MITQSYPFADLALSRRLEMAEAYGNVEFVKARAKAFPESRATWIEVSGTRAMFDGPNSPVSQTFGLGILQPSTRKDLDEVEQFFIDRETDVFHEVSPLSDQTTFVLLNERGYSPIEFTNVMFRPISSNLVLSAATNDKVTVHLTEENERELWSETAFKGWSEFDELADFLRDLGKVHACSSSPSFLASIDDQPVATGMLTIYDGVALLAGASTIPEARRQGAQLALLEARLQYAAEQGCDVAMMCALPGSASQRNAERHGFRIAYTRIKWRKSRYDNE